MLSLVAELLSNPHSPLSRLPSSQSYSHLFNSYFVSENYFGTSLSFPLFYSCLACATTRPYFHWVLHFFFPSALKYSSAVPYGGATLLLFHDYIRYVTVYSLTHPESAKNDCQCVSHQANLWIATASSTKKFTLLKFRT